MQAAYKVLNSWAVIKETLKDNTTESGYGGT